MDKYATDLLLLATLFHFHGCKSDHTGEAEYLLDSLERLERCRNPRQSMMIQYDPWAPSFEKQVERSWPLNLLGWNESLANTFLDLVEHVYIWQGHPWERWSRWLDAVRFWSCCSGHIFGLCLSFPVWPAPLFRTQMPTFHAKPPQFSSSFNRLRWSLCKRSEVSEFMSIVHYETDRWYVKHQILWDWGRVFLLWILLQRKVVAEGRGWVFLDASCAAVCSSSIATHVTCPDPEMSDIPNMMMDHDGS